MLLQPPSILPRPKLCAKFIDWFFKARGVPWDYLDELYFDLFD